MAKTKAKKITNWGKVLKIALGGSLAALTVFLAFIWPSTTSSVKNVELAVAGPQPQVQAVTSQLEETGETFKVRAVSGREEAERLIKAREVAGAVVLGPSPAVLTASANGPAMTQIFNRLSGQFQATIPDREVELVDVVPLLESDARGLGLTVTALPLVFAGIIGGILVSLLVTGAWQKAGAVSLYALLTGLVIALVVRFWLDLLPGNYLALSLTIALCVLATSALIVGLHSLLGPPGIGVGAAFTMLFANPLAGAALPVQFLAEPWGEIGQHLVPGAGLTLLRHVSYFHEASIASPLISLLVWAAFGLGLLAYSGRRKA